jgi:hypothetical protein
VNAGNAYLDAFLEAKIDLVPWGYPCERIEGGMFTGRNSPQDTCESGVPSGVNIANRRFIVDEVIGSVVVWCTFGAGGPTGGSGAPDAHLFRVEKGNSVTCTPSPICCRMPAHVPEAAVRQVQPRLRLPQMHLRLDREVPLAEEATRNCGNKLFGTPDVRGLKTLETLEVSKLSEGWLPMPKSSGSGTPGASRHPS